MPTLAKKLTYAEYAKIPADGFRHEILEGEEFMTPAPGTYHQQVVVNLTYLLRAHIGKRKLGRVFVAPTDLVLSRHDIVEPDLLFVSAARDATVGPRFIKGAPDLVVEVLSPSTAAVDRGRKLALYGRSGIREYWIVDSAARTVEVHEFGSPRRTRVYQEGQSFDSAVLPGLSIRLDDIF